MRLVWPQAMLLQGVMLSLFACAQVSESAVRPIVHRLSYDTPAAEGVRKLPQAVVVVPDRNVKLPELISAFASTAASSGSHEVPANSPHQLLATGPLLDQPDQVAALPLNREGNRFTLTLDYTSARASGMNLERNLRWLPLVQAALPNNLVPGEYSVTVIWRAVSSLSGGSHLPIKLLSEATTFQVRSR